MITLLTGAPGTGKTAWVVSELLKEKSTSENRNVYVHGIKELKIPHVPIYCKSNLCEICKSTEINDESLYVEEWPEWFELGSLIIVDECQRIWRPRGPSKEIPKSVSALETHRHHGLDFWIISQSPTLFDKSVRMLINRHIHLTANWRGRTQHEWSECREDVSRRNDAVIRDYKLPSNVYSLYHSAEIHTKIKKRKPLSFYFAILSIIISIILGYYIIQRLYVRVHNEPDEIVNTNQIKTSSKSKETKNSYPDFEPSIPGVPESAPAYAHLLKVTDVPTLAGCISSKTECKCYTGQGTPYPTSKKFCHEFVQGHRFNPYLVRNNNLDRNTLHDRQNAPMVTPPKNKNKINMDNEIYN